MRICYHLSSAVNTRCITSVFPGYVYCRIFPVIGYAHESLPVYAVQFHPERMCFAHRRDDTVDGSVLLRWFLSLCG